ncbi:hypothetical protein, unlikely [Trypanosoma brucei gambiense DAL972]|uniref:Uncharacterized protein n=1 Tax=Trypanosoma brucei gambiense (strain MHOM/CI/86/DAL972) TaxID=679716 RepID=D0A3U9_TRYB9|nr:hypothetical protein, unlikely [Trypanosoma brucei gambiense DAL972]CBH15943.1 hypothetical protein, unlikely [Trypanosoma brucei gambiense DAL972]|eukprot:XP_011778207.1 hypothetical protein, unlikely [Trypanosoma brucei gambiense DAL972]
MNRTPASGGGCSGGKVPVTFCVVIIFPPSFHCTLSTNVFFPRASRFTILCARRLFCGCMCVPVCASVGATPLCLLMKMCSSFTFFFFFFPSWVVKQHHHQNEISAEEGQLDQ